jgi:hypothetical protein
LAFRLIRQLDTAPLLPLQKPHAPRWDHAALEARASKPHLWDTDIENIIDIDFLLSFWCGMIQNRIHANPSRTPLALSDRLA